MNEQNDPKTEAALAATERRLQKRQQLRLSGAHPDMAGVHAYNDHKDYLIAAGLAAMLDRGEDEVRRYLAATGQAGIEVFRLHGTTVSEITALPSMETAAFVDDSAVNAQTFVDSAYALLAAGKAGQVADLLAAVDTAGLFAGPASGRSEWDYGALLKQALEHCFRGHSQPALPVRLPPRDDPALAYYQSQLDALRAAQPGGRAALKGALDALSRQTAAYYRSLGWEDDPVAHLALPVRGLSALAGACADQ